MRSGVAKYRVSEQEEMGWIHAASVLVDKRV